MSDSFERLRHPRWLAWLILGSSVMSAVFAVMSAMSGGRVTWTDWAVPLLLGGNTWVLLFDGLRRWKILERIYYAVSFTVALLVIVGVCSTRV